MNRAAPPPPVVRRLGVEGYAPVFERMRALTLARDELSPDEIWLLQHPPVFTQGQAGKAEHLLTPGDIPVVQSDRGGQVTYHGPGQIVGYVLVDLQRLGYGIRSLVTRIENSIVETLAGYGIAARARADAPGVYVGGRTIPLTHPLPARRGEGTSSSLRPPDLLEQKKIASLGLRVRKGCSYHGLALNVNMDLEPFSRINPCGYQGLQMTQIADLGGPADVEQVSRDLEPRLLRHLGLR